MTRIGIVINLDTCRDMRGCMVACKKETGAALGLHYVETYTAMTDDFPKPNTYFIPILCQQCANPSCISSCPAGVFGKRADGIVTVGSVEACKECVDKPCVAACPYGAIECDPMTGTIGKCDLCAGSLDESYVPACAAHCLTHSWLIGDLDDPESAVSQTVAQWGEYAHQLRPETGNGPSVYYLLSTKRWQDMDDLYSPAWHNE